MTPKVAVPESIRWTEWIPSTLRPPAWPIEVLPWLVGWTYFFFEKKCFLVHPIVQLVQLFDPYYYYLDFSDDCSDSRET